MEGDKLKVGRFTFEAATTHEGFGYAFVGHYAGTDIDILSYDDGESSGWTLADQQSGKEFGVPQLPIPSPDGAVWAVNWPFEAPDGEVMIYARGPEGWTKIAAFPMEWACGLKWIDASTLELKDHTGRAERPKSADWREGMARRIVLERDTWVLR